jgi:hypothetical protein
MLFKNIPACLLFRHALSLLYGQWYFMVMYRRPLATLAGYGSFLVNLPYVFQERRRILKNTVISLEQIDKLLTPAMEEPTLREVARRWWRSTRNKKT